MSKRIAFTITYNGVDGFEKTSIEYASWDEDERDQKYDNLKSPGYYNKNEMIVDEEAAHKQAMNKLDGVDRLVLELDQRKMVVK